MRLLLGRVLAEEPDGRLRAAVLMSTGRAIGTKAPLIRWEPDTERAGRARETREANETGEGPSGLAALAGCHAPAPRSGQKGCRRDAGDAGGPECRPTECSIC